MNNPHNINAIALAGGRSSRMGRDKALLELGCETMLARTCHAALQVASAIYVVVHSPEQYQDAWQNSQSPQKALTMVVDRYLDGALVGFWQGLEAIAEPCEWVLLLACDLPNLRGDILETWAQDLESLPAEAIAYLPSHSSQDARKLWEPLCGFYRWQCRELLADFVKSGGRSFQKWLSDQQYDSQVIEIPNIPSAMLLNCNTPEDFIAVSSQYPQSRDNSNKK